jgi:hypothetical protein
MVDNLKIITQTGSDLAADDYVQIGDSLFREFNHVIPSPDKLRDRKFFLLKNNTSVLALGALLEVSPVIFNGDKYSISGFVNVVANVKGRGYGKQVITAMIDYLITHDKTGLGFCMLKNKEFYENCGLEVITDITQRFVCRNGAEKITNQDGQIIFYQDSSDHFMKNVLANPGKEIRLPTQNLW